MYFVISFLPYCLLFSDMKISSFLLSKRSNLVCFLYFGQNPKSIPAISVLNKCEFQSQVRLKGAKTDFESAPCGLDPKINRANRSLITPKGFAQDNLLHQIPQTI